MNEIMLIKLVTKMNEKNARSNQPTNHKINKLSTFYAQHSWKYYKKGAMTWNSDVRL